MHPQSNTPRQQFVRICDCGCGHPTLISPDTVARRGLRRGQPYRYLHGHNAQTRGDRPSYRVDEAGCWTWQRKKSKDGYGRLSVQGRPRYAHVVYFEAVHGPVPEGYELDHLCRNRACVNPDHLEPVTHLENMRRSTVVRFTRSHIAVICRLRELGLSQFQIGKIMGARQVTIGEILSKHYHGHVPNARQHYRPQAA